MNSLILVDASYTSFYRFFATLRWFSMNQPDFFKEKKSDVKYDWSENQIFIEKYEKVENAINKYTLNNDGICILFNREYATKTIDYPSEKLKKDILEKLPNGYLFINYVYLNKISFKYILYKLYSDQLL